MNFYKAVIFLITRRLRSKVRRSLFCLFYSNPLKRPWCLERLTVGGEGGERGGDGWMASPTRRTWVWVNSGRWWWTGRPGELRFMGSQRVSHDLVTGRKQPLNSLYWVAHKSCWCRQNMATSCTIPSFVAHSDGIVPTLYVCPTTKTLHSEGTEQSKWRATIKCLICIFKDCINCLLVWWDLWEWKAMLNQTTFSWVVGRRCCCPLDI